jgi:hypothetical protein
MFAGMLWVEMTARRASGDRFTVFYRRLAAPFCVDMKAVFARRKRA